jgi:hypothetical protein
MFQALRRFIASLSTILDTRFSTRSEAHSTTPSKPGKPAKPSPDFPVFADQEVQRRADPKVQRS